MNLSEMSLIELKQHRAHTHQLLVECDKKPDVAAARVAGNGLHIELDAVNREIQKREGTLNAEAKRRAGSLTARMATESMRRALSCGRIRA